MRAIVEMNACLTRPVSRIATGQRLHGGNRRFVSLNDRVVGSQVGDVAARRPILDIAGLATARPSDETDRTESAGPFNEFATREKVKWIHEAASCSQRSKV